MAPPTPESETLFHIRPAEPRDADAIAMVHRASMREAMPWLPDLHTPEEDRDWVAQIVLPQQDVWVAEAAGHIVGVASMDTDAMLTQLYILPGHQGAGIGSALLETAKTARPAGFTLFAFQRNTRARQFYEHRGFVPIAFGDGSGNEEGEPDILYRWSPNDSEQRAKIVSF
jgi:GNAT superfamily N-acetyltransferase